MSKIWWCWTTVEIASAHMPPGSRFGEANPKGGANPTLVLDKQVLGHGVNKPLLAVPTVENAQIITGAATCVSTCTRVRTKI
jgi:hypothetical protein